MGRRKVDPEKRVRVVRACVQCKYSKKRCNASLPCANCVRRGIADACTFDDTQQWVPPVQPTRPSAAVSFDNQASGNVFSTSLGTDSRTPGVSSSSTGTAATPHRTKSRMLSNSHGHQVYIGPSASLSFLQLVRDTVTDSIGVSEFSQNAKQNQMLEAGSASDSETEADPQCPRKMEYAQNFLANTRGFLGFLSKQETFSTVQKYPDSLQDSPPHKLAIACLIIAIGAQCSAKDNESSKDERRALSIAQRAVFSDMLQDPSIEMIQAFLLLAFYMLGSCKRNAAFMYLGVAARAAFALGLHSSDTDKTMSETNRKSSTNTWKSLVNLDLICSSILGRTAATAVSRNGDGDSTPHRHNIPIEVLTLRSSYQLSLLVDEIVSTLYGPQGVSLETAERYLSFLNQWSETLPAHLRISKMPQHSDTDALARVVGSLHISCYYHFAVMLVSRPFLITHLVESIHGTPSAGTDKPDAASTAEMAQTCMKAAVLMAQTCSDVEEAGFMMESMCILKAWIFAAGLVLGFSMFATDQTDFEVDEAFMGARNVLQKLSARSEQAAHYAEILKHFAGAITKQRRSRRSSRKESEINAVDKILDFRSSAQKQHSNPMNDTEITNAGNMIHNTFPADDMMQNIAFNAYTGPSIDLDGAVFGWDSAALQFWDQFPFDLRGLESSDPFIS